MTITSILPIFKNIYERMNIIVKKRANAKEIRVKRTIPVSRNVIFFLRNLRY